MWCDVRLLFSSGDVVCGMTVVPPHGLNKEEAVDGEYGCLT